MSTIKKQTSKKEQESFQKLKNKLTVCGAIMIFVGLVSFLLSFASVYSAWQNDRGSDRLLAFLFALLGIASEAILPSVIIARCYSSHRENNKTAQQNFKTGFWMSMRVIVGIALMVYAVIHLS